MPNQDALLFIDGKQIKPSELPIIPLDGFNFSVFETMKSHKGNIIYLKEHLDRLFESAKSSGIKIPKSRKQIEKELRKVMVDLSLPEPSLGRLSPLFLRIAATNQHVFVIASSRTYPEKIYKEGVDLKTSTVKRNLSNSVPPEVKSSEFLNGILGILDLKNIFDVLFLDSDGYVREAGIWNFFIVKNNIIKTPPSAGILNGVVRRFVIKWAYQMGIQADEVFFTRHDVFNADEAFLTNSAGGIVPVRSLDNRLIGEKIPGLITHKLSQQLKKSYDSN